MSSHRQTKKIEANVSVLILIAVINNPHKEPVTIGQIKEHLMKAPFEMTSGEADEAIHGVHGLKLKGKGGEAVISGISLPSFALEKRVLPFNLKIRPFLPEAVFEKIKGEKALNRKVAIIVGLMDHMGIYVYQEQVREFLIRDIRYKLDSSLRADPIVQAISNAVAQKGWVSKPFGQKGINAVLASSDEGYEGIAEFTDLYDKLLIKSLKEAQPKGKKELDYLANIRGDLDATVTIDGKHMKADIVAGDEVLDVVDAAVRRFAAELAVIKKKEKNA
ncbi:hypothetical protein C4544_03035 [candidate division WS5 bacterium]|uniref:Uncharacterized protein n=1 Tax=candidate division WS5 bacterium TaxID=2093353 RepID=A0A419DE93_9BACT|nr:MAG: hypothetical protein C4544_03035 [candidate division WS5 bacterium]